MRARLFSTLCSMGLLWLVGLGGCDSGSSTEPDPTPDAAEDASPDPDPDATEPDAPDPNACTGALYDSCDPNDVNTCAPDTYCQTYNQAGISVCTQNCDGNTPCPDQNGESVQCNGMGRCRPAAANDCTL